MQHPRYRQGPPALISRYRSSHVVLRHVTLWWECKKLISLRRAAGPRQRAGRRAGFPTRGRRPTDDASRTIDL